MSITSTIPNLINGVSQQPDTLRLSSQAQEQINFLSAVSDGLTRRPGTRHLATLAGTGWSGAFLHSIDRDSSENYIATIRDGVLAVYDAMTGEAKTVNAPDGLSYLEGGGQFSYRAVTVADYTFIINRDKVVGKAAALTPSRVNQAIIHVRSANYGKQYDVFINGVNRARAYTPDGSASWHTNDINTDLVAARIYNTLVGGGAYRFHVDYQTVFVQGSGSFSDFSYTISGSTITITRSTSTPFTISIADGTGGTALLGVVSQVQRFADLPKLAPNGFSVEIIGDSESAFDNYHVKFTQDGSGGVWEETLKGGEAYQFDATTMPHILVREADGTFTFKKGSWEGRKVGDIESIPFPSFLGRKINDVFFYRNRLGFLSDENVILSKQGEFFDFFRDTATTLLDTDPLDLAVSSANVSILNHALPLNKSLLLFSSGAQFILEGGDILSAETASVTQITQFENAATVRPVGVGQFVYFPVPKGSYSGIREFSLGSSSDNADALDVTSHCPRYLPKKMFSLCASTSADILIGLSSETPNSLWVYKFFFGDQGKLQSAWSEWRMAPGDNILSINFIDTKLFLVIARPSGTFIETLEVESQSLGGDASFPYYVDRGVHLSGGAFDGTKTTYALPYETSEEMWAFVGGGAATEGRSLIFTRPDSSHIAIGGDTTGLPIFCGTRFTSTYTFSKFFVRRNDTGGGVIAQDDGRLQIRRLYLNYARSGSFNVSVTPRGRDTFTLTFGGRVLANTRIGSLELQDGRFSVPIMCRNRDATIQIHTDSYLPCSFTSAEWEATYHPREQRM